MKRDFCPILFLPFLAVTLVALAPRVSAQVDPSGSWVMDLTANSPEEDPCIYSGDGQIEQNGSSLTGSLVLSLVSGPALCPPEVMGNIDGTVDGDSVFGNVDGGQLGFASFTGSPSNSFAGTFVVSDGPFVGIDGTWLAVRPNPSLALIKGGTFDDESGDGFAQAGETISYSFEVTNTGNQTLSSVAVSDPLVSTISCPGGNPIPSLAPEATETCTGSYTVTQADVDAGSRDNTATAAGEDPDGGPVSDSDSVTTTLPIAPSVALIKSGTFDDESGDGFAQAGETISYSFAVTNTGNQTLSSVAVSDPLVPTISCPGGNPIPSLAPDTTETCTGSYAVTQADVDAGSRDNTATAAGEDPDGDPVSVSDTTSTMLIAAPEVSATKTSSFDLSSQDNDGSGDLTPGDDLTYTVTIINDGSGEATGVIFDDTPDPNTGLVVGSVTTTRGTVDGGNTAGDTAVRVTAGTLASGGSVTVTFDVTIDDPLPEGVTSVVNQGVVSGDNFASVVTDDPDTASDNDGTSDHVNSPPEPPTEVPSLSQGGLLLLMLLLLSTVAARRLHY